MTNRIVVGIDGSEGSAMALRWAVEEAQVREADLEAVLVWSYLAQHHLDPKAPFDPHYDEGAAREVLRTWVTEAVGDPKGIALRTICDLPERGLVDAGADAQLIVVGARGRGGFHELRLGSVSARVVEHSDQPVAVVRHTAPVFGGRVVVGVDGSTKARQALRWAAEEARRRSATLHVIHSWQAQALAASPWGPSAPTLGDLEAAGREILDAALADEALEGLDVASHLMHGGAAATLLERAQGAGLVVVGSRGLGRVLGALLGSVARQVLHHAPCPVVVT